MLLAGEAARLYATYTVPEVADILDAPLDRVQAALRDYGVLTPRNAAGLVRQGWTVAAIAREWGMHPSTVDRWVREGR
jgi:transposase-like protein